MSTFVSMFITFTAIHGYYKSWTMSIRNPNNDDLEDDKPLINKEAKKDSNDDIPLCGFMNIRYYQPVSCFSERWITIFNFEKYFDVDSSEVYSRLTHSLIYCKVIHYMILLFIVTFY